MKKKTIAYRLTQLALSLALLTASTAQAGWLTTYGTPDDDIGAAVPSTQGGYYVTLVAGSLSGFDIPTGFPTDLGSLTSTASKPSQLLSFIDANGSPLWTNKIGTGKYDTFFTTELADGRLLVQGVTQATRTAQTDAVWAIYNVNRATGQMTPVFRNIYKTTGYDQMMITPDAQGVLWAQGSTVAAGDSNIIVAKINATTGAPDWSSVLHYAKDDSLAAFTPKGNQFILVSNAGTASEQSVLIGLLNDHGLPVVGSFKKYGTGGINAAQGLKAVTGGYLLYGTISTPNATGSANTTAFVAKLSTSLKMLWGKKYNAGKDTSLMVTAVDENTDGSLTLTGSINEMGYTKQFGVLIPSAPTLHPATIRLSATGGVLSGKHFKLNDMDMAFFFKNENGDYLLGGQTTKTSSMDMTDLTNLDPANLDLSSLMGGSDTDLLYGAFNNNFVPSWVKTLGGAKTDSGSIIPRASGGYTVTGVSSSWGAGKSDILVGELDNNGNIAGCTDIKNVTLKETALTITASNLGWKPQVAALVRKGGISKANLTTLTVTASPTITATPVCN